MIDRSLERFVQEQMIATRIPGLSLVLLRDGEVEERHFGFKELRRREPPGSDTRYGLGSVTKVFTAVATLQLVDEGRVGLEDRIAEHLPGEADVFGDATVRHLLAHASGLPAFGWSETKMSRSWFMDGFPVGNFADLSTFLDGADAWRSAAPGERWHYSNEGYIVLGRLIERLDGVDYVTSLRRRLLEPLGMTRSTFDVDEVEGDADRVQPFMLDERGELIPGANLHGTMPAAGGLLSTAADMTRFARLLIDGGRSPSGARLLSEASFEAMAAPVVPIDPPTPFDTLPLWADPPRTNGAGLQVHHDVFGHDVRAHGGGVMGGTTYLAVVPERRLGVVILANAHGYPLAQLALVALARGLGGTPDDLPFLRRQRLLERYAGSYAGPSGTIRASLQPRGWGLELQLDFRPRGRGVPLVLLEHDEARGTTRFLTLASGRPGIAELRDDGEAPLLVYERYALRRRGEVHR
jgi:CubicO group peptidase (beta-lactamase class C family)